MNTTHKHTARRTACALVALVAMTGSIACAASLTLTGEQEVPPVITSGNGSGELTVATDGAISGGITTHGVPGTMAHIHLGGVGVNGPVIISLIKGEGGMWQVPPASRLTVDQLAAYRAGKLYVNVHSDTHKGGEVRAQLSP
jgi:hypothetical protein